MNDEALKNLTLTEELPQPTPLAPASDGAARPKQKQQFKRDKRDVHGWIVLDKPVGMTSTHAVSVIKRLFTAKRAGHAGTLDPLASGALPIALGEATKTVPFVMDGRKLHHLAVAREIVGALALDLDGRIARRHLLNAAGKGRQQRPDCIG